MSTLRELLQDLAPGSVRNVALGEVGEFIRGRRFTKADYVESGLGSIHYGEIYTDYGTTASSVHRFVRPELRGSLRLARRGDLVIAATGENVQDVCKAVAWLGDEEVAVHDDCYIFRHDLDPTYAAYLFQSAVFNDQKARLASESKLARISGANLAKIIAPVPPMSVQREVVAVLDRFSALQAELETQLQAEVRARRAQFTHYRDALLSFDADLSLSLSLSRRTRLMTLGEFAQIGTGSSDRKDAASDGRYPLYVRSKNVLASDQYEFDEDAVVVPGEGGIGEIFHHVSGKYALHQRAYRLAPDVSVVLPRYLMYYMTVHFKDFIVGRAVNATVTSIRKPMLEAFPVAIPSVEEQALIVARLDRVAEKAEGLGSALTHELAARRKQYEYYRDKLLTFEEAV